VGFLGFLCGLAEFASLYTSRVLRGALRFFNEIILLIKKKNIFLSHSFTLWFLTVYCFLLLFLLLSSLPVISNVVTMQAQRTAPPDMACRDKFLIQSTIVPDGTTDENITPSMVSFCSFCS
jgi:hypothetical protein